MPELLDRLKLVLGEGFRVERELGGGGMSRVFLVHDDSLDRQVVVKVLPPDLAEGLSEERFKREILLAAKLQHPHIVPLLTAGAREGLLYYVMPFIDGESLRARLARHHELPVGEVTRILRDVADALAFAHANGVVHRDIKPDNVLMAGHHALVTDFGVSRALSNAGDTTITSVGMALGTPAYMSPEQALADPAVDHRADIYSVGALGYELLTGRQPFSGMTPQQVLAAHISVAPEHVSVHRATVPPALAAAIMKCLEKRPADRWQRADELVAHLEAIATPSGGLQPSTALPAPARPFNRWLIGGLAAAVVVLAVGGWWMTRPVPAYSVGSTTQVTNAPGLELDASVSPDGRLLAYSSGSAGRTQVFVRQVSGGTARALTDRAPGAQRSPRWSADGQSITFLVGQSLYRTPALGGTPELVVDAGDYEFANPALSPDGKSVAWADQNAVYVRALAGGADRKIAETSYPNYLVWSPDGQRLAYVSDNAWFIYGRNNLGNLAPSSVWAVDVAGGAPVRISNTTHLNTSPVWTPDGRSILYVSSVGGSRDVYEQRLSAGGKPRGAPIRLTTGLNAHTISLSSDGSRLAYSVLTTRSNLWWAPISPSGVTPFSAATPITNENQTVEGMAISPDGEWLVYDSSRGGGGAQAIFKIRVEGGEPVQLTRDSADVFLPSWSPDGREVAYHSWRAGNRDVYIVGADGQAPRAATTDAGHEMYPIWSPSGRELLFISDRNKRWELHVISKNDDGSWTPSKQLTSNFGYNGRWSPDGQHVAYVSLVDTTIHVMKADGTGARLLFDGHALGLTTPQVAFGRRPDVLYFHAVDRESRHAFYEIPLSGGAPRLVFAFPELGPQPRRTEFDTDGRRLFFTVATDESDVWLMDLQRK